MFELEDWDAGRLRINRSFSQILLASGLTTFAGMYSLAGGELVRAVGNRRTTRVVLSLEGVSQTFFLKRHGRPRLRERLKPLAHLSWPILGARNEWEAILRFHAAGIPTMTPVAFGETGGESLVMTQEVAAERTLLDWVNRRTGEEVEGESESSCDPLALKRRITQRIAAIARRMHDSGLHHQDFYLNHLLFRGKDSGPDICVIDLGRVRHVPKLSRRWIIKDLAQLDYSARNLSCADRLRFLRLYLGRPFCAADRWLVRQIALKSWWIAAHTAKNGL